MTVAIVLTAAIWITFFAVRDQSPTGDYGPGLLIMMQLALSTIVTLVVWLVYFAWT